MTGTEYDRIAAFLRTDASQQWRQALDPSLEPELREFLGAGALGELQALARSVTSHLAGPAAPNLIFVPGVMGSVLASQGLGGVWWLDIRSRDRIDRLQLAANGQNDAEPGARISPVAVDLSYSGFLAAVERAEGFSHLAFAYDWRKPLAVSARRLRETVLAAQAQNSGRPVHLVAHSMGGLVVQTALMLHPELWRHVGKMVFMGTPHYGAPAVAGYLKNHLWGFHLMALLGRYLSRETFRSLWGVLELLPAPEGVYPGTSDRAGTAHPCANFDLYDARSWHLGLTPEQEGRLQTVLDYAAAQHRSRSEWHENLDQNLCDRMAVIAGVGFKTLFRTAYKRQFGYLWTHMDRVTSRVPGDVNREGDGRVPLASAILERTGETRYAPVKHADLPNVKEVYEDVFRFLSGTAMQLPQTPRDEHLAGGSWSNETPLLTGSGPTPDECLDDPGYLDLAELPDDVAEELETRLAAGGLPEFSRLHIL
ncbi:hypothetical protein OG453_37750 [Streptomyces sp. NBC_01381]|uniref:lipase family alpha/beta hydrolase n=1 Tax=Streptomyces sp. NBC_01381 TaxID=2903845 RepID=UPI0022505D7C|nr:alpha/beta fold hydrolase [Streptomyces sp. NBC_01381]MCX4672345.1 hypothetical protein [Streptomyces sp. NBC_01381]